MLRCVPCAQKLGAWDLQSTLAHPPDTMQASLRHSALLGRPLVCRRAQVARRPGRGALYRPLASFNLSDYYEAVISE